MWAILPLKDFVSAKQRLSGVLSASERRRLFHAMVEDVLSALSHAETIDSIVIVSDDPAASLLAERYGAVVLDEPAAAENTQHRANEPLNRALAAACNYIAEASSSSAEASNSTSEASSDDVTESPTKAHVLKFKGQS